MPHLSTSQFTERFISLVLGARDLPKKPSDRHILFVSAVLRLEPGRQYAESELNDKLMKWSDRFGRNFGLNHVTLRRFLVDEGYLRRDSYGKAYQLAVDALPYTFDPALRELDLEALIAEARRARDARKQQFMKKG